MARLRVLFVETGQRIGRGIVIDPEIRIPESGKSTPGAKLRCDCGNIYEVPVRKLAGAGRPTLSCGCLMREAASQIHLLSPEKHGMARHPLYKTWNRMLARCESPGDYAYKNYGGRGIKVCDAWHDVRVFVADIERLIGPRPEDMTLDRIDNDGNYEPGNVRWATWAEQARNRRARYRDAA